MIRINVNDMFVGGEEMLSVKIKVERVKKGWTQEQLSEKSGVGRVSISNIERKGIENIPVSTLRKLSAALGLSINELFFDKE
jgi:putative transcriptional regulator